MHNLDARDDVDTLESVLAQQREQIDKYREENYDDLLDAKTKKEIEQSLRDNLKNNFGQDNILISAKTKENLETFRELLTERVREQYQIRYPYQSKQW